VTWYRVELRGESREVYAVEADSADEAREVWAERGTLEVQECYGMGVESVEEDE
jgi:Zn-finger nucleic acid-binding protein